jgi:hypothetical protein
MFVRKLTRGAAAGYVWDEDGAVIEIPDRHGNQLLRIPGFEKAEPDMAEPRRRGRPPGSKNRVFHEVDFHDGDSIEE